MALVTQQLLFSSSTLLDASICFKKKMWAVILKLVISAAGRVSIILKFLVLSSTLG